MTNYTRRLGVSTNLFAAVIMVGVTANVSGLQWVPLVTCAYFVASASWHVLTPVSGEKQTKSGE